MTSRADATLPERLPWRGFAWRRVALSFGLTLLALFTFAAVFAGAYARLHEGRVLPGVDVGGVELAGLDRAAAGRKLRAALPDLGRGALTVGVAGETERIRYSQVERDYAITGMLDQAFMIGHGGGPVDQFVAQMRTMIDGVHVPLAVSWDSAELVRRVTAFAVAQEAPAIDASISRPEGEYVVSGSSVGSSVDEQGAVRLAMAALDNLSASDTAITVQATPIEPAVTTQQAQAAADSANAVSAAPLVLAAGETSMTIDAATINGWVHLDEATGGGSWQVSIEPAAVYQVVDAYKKQVDVPATNAAWSFEGREKVVSPAADGQEIDREAAISSVLDTLNGRAAGSSDDRINLAMVPVAPELGTAEAQSLVSRVERLSRWTTRYESSARNGFGQNIRRPTNLIDGTVVQPGEEFDFVAIAGPITEGNGYTSGAAIIHGNTRLDGVLGGGLCSCSTTLFNAALRAGFEMGARRNHAYYIDRYPVGLDATIWINGSYVQTMTFTNDSDYPIVIRGINRRGAVEFQIWGVPDGREVRISRPRVWNEREAWTRIQYTDNLPAGRTERIEYPFAGFNSEVTRTVTAADGTVLHEDVFNSRYKRVIGYVLVGREPGDPPAGTIVENPPPDA